MGAIQQDCRPLVSIIVPVYNVERYLAQCLDSILAQSMTDFEAIVINDGSTDNSLSIMRDYAMRDKRIIVVDKPNEGYGASCNRGLSLARGAWIAIVEPDDWIEPNMYRDLIAFADAFDNPIDIVKSNYWRIWMPDTPKQLKVPCNFVNRVHPPHQPFWIGEATELIIRHPSIWSALYRKSFLKEHNVHFPEIPGAGWADNPFSANVYCQARHIAYLNRSYYCYRSETPEKTRQLVEMTPLLPMQRWNDMMDIVESLGVDDDRVLAAYAKRCFIYLGTVGTPENLARDDMKTELEKAFARIAPRHVFDNPTIQPAHKILFASFRGIEPEGVDAIDKLRYLREIAKDGIYNIVNGGVLYTLARVKERLSKH